MRLTVEGAVVIAQNVLMYLAEMPRIWVNGEQIPLVDKGEKAGPESAATWMLLRYLQEHGTWNAVRESSYYAYMDAELNCQRLAGQVNAAHAASRNREVRLEHERAMRRYRWRNRAAWLFLGWPLRRLLIHEPERVLEPEDVPVFPTEQDLRTGLARLIAHNFVVSLDHQGVQLLYPSADFVGWIVREHIVPARGTAE